MAVANLAERYLAMSRARKEEERAEAEGLAALAETPDNERGARFICALVFLRHAEDPVPLIAIGEWQGRVLTAPRGSGGFGYDPLFLVPETGLSAAELDAADNGLFLVVCGEHDDRQIAELLHGLAERKAIHDRHIDIHQDNIGVI